MSLLQEIQESILDDKIGLGPTFLKLRLLAARLGSSELEEWVKFESEGYPADALLPDYRKILVAYWGTLSYSDGYEMEDTHIPPYWIEKFVGKRWKKHEIRQGIAAIDELVDSSEKKGDLLAIDTGNLILILQGKVYEDRYFNDIRGFISRASIPELLHVVRNRVLEFTIKIEKSIPGAIDISFGNKKSANREMSSKVTHISNTIIYGNSTSIASSGDNASFSLSINPGDGESLKKYLVDGGLDESDANRLSEIISSEVGGDKNEPLGTKAKEWLVENIKKATDGTWKVGILVAIELIKKAALKYYDFD